MELHICGRLSVLPCEHFNERVNVARDDDREWLSVQIVGPCHLHDTLDTQITFVLVHRDVRHTLLVQTQTQPYGGWIHIQWRAFYQE